MDPDAAEDRLATWRVEGCGPGTSFAADLLVSKAKSTAAAVFFVFLLTLTADIIWEEAQMAEMPGKFMAIFGS